MKTYTPTEIYSPVFMAALFIIAGAGNSPDVLKWIDG